MTTPSTPTSKEVEARACLEMFLANNPDGEFRITSPDGDYLMLSAHELRSLVEAQPSYEERVGRYAVQQATKHGWSRDQPEDAFMFMMRRCREVALEDARQPSAVAGEAVPIAVLRDHWLRALECDHEGKRDKPHCACCAVDLGWHPTVGRAVEAWLEHVASVGLPLKGEVPTPAHNGHPMRHWDRTCPACIASIDNGAAGEGAAAPSFRDRCRVAQECLPQADYRDRLTALHEEMLAALAAAPVETEQPVAYLMRKRMPGYEWREWTTCDAHDHAAIQKQGTHWGMEHESMAVYARPTPAAGVPPDLIERIDAAIQRIVNGQGCMRIPAENTDPDLVLAECKRILAARPLPGGVPTGLPTEAIEDAASVLRHIGPQLNAEWAHRCARAAAALSAGAPSSQGGA